MTGAIPPPEPPTPGKAAAGWYADPLGIGKHRYWDGDNWTERTVRPNPISRVRNLSAPEIVIGIAGLALAVSPFLVWARVIIFGDYNLFHLLTSDGSSHTLAWLFILAGAGTAAIAFLVRTDTKIVAIGVGLIAGFLALLKAIHLVHQVNAAKGAAKMGYGPWVAVAACAVMIVAGFVETRSQKETASVPPPQL
jgi:Protein of unknown function (DUF2510)